MFKNSNTGKQSLTNLNLIVFNQKKEICYEEKLSYERRGQLLPSERRHYITF